MANLHAVAEGLHIALFVSGVLSLFLRFYSRAIVIRKWGFDDTIAVATLVLYVALQATHQLVLDTGCGLNDLDKCNPMTDPDLPKILFSVQILYALIHFTIKSGFLAFYVHLSPSRTFRMMVYLGAALNTLVLISNELLVILRCLPVRGLFSPSLAKCMPPAIMFWSPVVLNLAVDFYILILPIPVIWTLRMPTRRRLAVIGIFSSGFTAILTSVFWVFAWDNVRDNKRSPAIAINTIISSIELFFAIMAVNMPSFKPIWTKLTGESTTRQGLSYQMKGSLHDKGTPRSKLTDSSVESAKKEVDTPLGSGLVSPIGVPSRKLTRGLASESEEDLVHAHTLENMSDPQEAERKQVWRSSEGVEFFMHTAPAVGSHRTFVDASTEEIREKPGREEVWTQTR